VSSASTFPYEYHKARYIRSGVELIADGQATILSASATDIEMCVVWGLMPQLSSLINDGTTLNQLIDNNATLTWHTLTSPETYASIANKDYFFAGMYFYYSTLPSEWWENIYSTAPDTTSEPQPDALDYMPNTQVRKYTNWLNPSVRVSYLLNLINSQCNVDFHWSGNALTRINNLIIPLTTRKPNESSYTTDFSMYYIGNGHSAGAYTNTLSLDITTGSPYINPTSGFGVNSFVVNSDISVMFFMSCLVRWNFNGLSQNNDGSYFFVGGFHQISIKHTDNTTDTYGCGHWRKGRPKGIKGSELKTIFGYKSLEEYEYAKGVVDLKQGDIITIQWSTEVRSPFGSQPLIHGQRPALTYSTATIWFSLITDAKVVTDGQQYPICHNLPDIKIVDFVRCLAAITGTFPMQPKQGTTEQVTFVPIDALWNNMPNAKDWSGKLVAQRNENVPKKLEWNMSEWAQNNWYRWKDDETITEGYGDGCLTIPNETLDMERDVVTFPFAATEGNVIPCYGGDGTKDIEPRLVTLVEDESGYAAGVFDLQMDIILGSLYSQIAATLQDIHVITETFIISDWELLNFDETIPIYLRQYGAYFAVLEIKSSKAGIAEVQMLKLN
jgi:hypothetical protein